jgi:hypothetical protein
VGGRIEPVDEETRGADAVEAVGVEDRLDRGVLRRRAAAGRAEILGQSRRR